MGYMDTGDNRAIVDAWRCPSWPVYYQQPPHDTYPPTIDLKPIEDRLERIENLLQEIKEAKK